MPSWLRKAAVGYPWWHHACKGDGRCRRPRVERPHCPGITLSRLGTEIKGQSRPSPSLSPGPNSKAYNGHRRRREIGEGLDLVMSHDAELLTRLEDA